MCGRAAVSESGPRCEPTLAHFCDTLPAFELPWFEGNRLLLYYASGAHAAALDRTDTGACVFCTFIPHLFLRRKTARLIASFFFPVIWKETFSSPSGLRNRRSSRECSARD